MERALSGLRNNAKGFLVRSFHVEESYTPEFEDVGNNGVGLVFIQQYNPISLSTLSIYSIRWDYRFSSSLENIEKVLLHGNEIITGVSFNSGTMTVTTNIGASLGLLVQFGSYWQS